VYSYTKSPVSQSYVGKELVKLDSVSDGVSDGVYQLFSSGQIIWHKVSHGETTPTCKFYIN